MKLFLGRLAPSLSLIHSFEWYSTLIKQPRSCLYADSTSRRRHESFYSIVYGAPWMSKLSVNAYTLHINRGPYGWMDQLKLSIRTTSFILIGLCSSPHPLFLDTSLFSKGSELHDQAGKEWIQSSPSCLIFEMLKRELNSRPLWLSIHFVSRILLTHLLSQGKNTLHLQSLNSVF